MSLERPLPLGRLRRSVVGDGPDVLDGTEALAVGRDGFDVPQGRGNHSRTLQLPTSPDFESGTSAILVVLETRCGDT